MSQDVTAQSYTLRTENGSWLGQIVLTNDGAFMAVTDWGNFSYAWRSYGSDFKKFMLGLDCYYFADKMVLGLSYTVTPTKKIRESAQRFADKILPALQAVLKEELKQPEA